MRRALVAFIIFAWASLGMDARQALAEPRAGEPATAPTHMVLERSGCSPLPFNEDALASRLRVELAELGVRSVDSESKEDAIGSDRDDTIRVSLVGACSDGELTVIMRHKGTPDTRRSLNISRIDRTIRERSLALMIAELLRSRPTQLASDDPRDDIAPGRQLEHNHAANTEFNSTELKITPSVVTTSPETSAPARSSHNDRGEAPTLLSAGIEWRFLFEQNTALTGGRLAASFPSGSDWLVRGFAEAGAFYDSEEDEAGTVEVWLVTGALGVSGGYAWKQAEIGFGPRVEVGWGHARAEPSLSRGSPESDDGAILIASMVASGRARFGPRLWLTMDIEIGRVLRGVSAPPLDRAPLAIRGAMGGGRLGVAIGL